MQEQDVEHVELKSECVQRNVPLGVLAEQPEHVELRTECVQKSVPLGMLPEKSKRKYNDMYNDFEKWRAAKEITYFSEEVFLDYFTELSKELAPSSLWARYSMLKSTVKAYDQIDISMYKNLLAFLKENSTGHEAKKSKVLTAADVTRFCNEAPDEKFLATKVALILGISGACKREELTNITLGDVEDHKIMLLIRIPKSDTNMERSFTVTGEFYNICAKYMRLRPENTKNSRFFLNYQNGHCTKQPIGINKFGGMPKEVATFLGLDDPKSYTGHCFRRTSATLMAGTGISLTKMRRQQRRWRASMAGEDGAEDPLSDERILGDQIARSVSLVSSNDETNIEGQNTHLFPEPGNDETGIDDEITSSYSVNALISEMATTSDSPQPKRFKLTHNANSHKPTLTSTSQNNDTESEDTHSPLRKEVDDYVLTFDPDQSKNSSFVFQNCNVTINIIKRKDD